MMFVRRFRQALGNPILDLSNTMAWPLSVFSWEQPTGKKCGLRTSSKHSCHWMEIYAVGH